MEITKIQITWISNMTHSNHAREIPITGKRLRDSEYVRLDIDAKDVISMDV